MARDEPGTPPSFTPGGGASRPAARDAVAVGRDEARAPGKPARPAGQRTPDSPAAEARTQRAAAPGAPRRTSSPSSSRQPTPPRAGATPPSFSPGSAQPAVGSTARSGTARSGTAPSDAARPATARPAGRPAAGARSASGHPATGRAAGAPPSRPGTGRGGPTGQGPQAPAGTPRRKRRLRVTLAVVALLLVLALAWPIGLVMWANGKIQHTEALSGADGTPGTTYLITGSDSRSDGGVKDDGTSGQRSDTILLLHVPESGPTALISLPRDTYVEIPGKGPGKINAAFAYGGAPLLVATVEQLSGLTVDHYAEIGMAGVKQVVDAVGGVRLCYDHDVDDRDSKLKWKSGCHTVGGTRALQFARMRKSDPLGDIGRAERQRQLVKAVLANVDPRQLALHPSRQVALVDAATATLTVDESSDIIDLGRLALAFRAANSDAGITGTPPIASMDYRPGGVGSTVLLDPDETPTFFRQIRDGKLEPGKVGGV